MLMKQCTDQIKDLRSEVCDLKQSLEFSQSQVGELKSEIVHMKKTISDITEANLPNRTMKLEDDTRKKNIRISGLPESSSETTEQTLVKVQEVLKTKLGVDHRHVVSAIRTGKIYNSAKPRMVLARFSAVENRNLCLRNSSKLKGTNIFINEDVSPATQAIRNSKWEQLRAKRQQGYIAYFSGVNIITKPRRAVPNEERTSFDRTETVVLQNEPSVTTGASSGTYREKKLESVSFGKTSTRSKNPLKKNKLLVYSIPR